MIEAVALYAGSFDPPTNGHLWMIQKAAEMFQVVIVAIAHNPAKIPNRTDIAARAEILTKECDRIVDGMVVEKAPTIHVQVVPPTRYVADLARQLGATYLIRGLRGAEDLPHEQALRDFAEARAGLTTILLMPPPAIRGLSSSYVRALVGPDGWRKLVRRLVPAGTLEHLTHAHYLTLAKGMKR